MTASVLNALSPVATVSGGLNSGSRMATGEDFSTSFLQQIKGLQAQTPETTQPGSVLEKIAGLIKGQKGQDFSALLGDSLPQIKQQMQAQDINLDATMTALKDILAQLDSLSSDSNLPASTLQSFTAKVGQGAMADTGGEILTSVEPEITNSDSLLSGTPGLLVPLSADVSANRLMQETNEVDEQVINTLDLAANISNLLNQVNQPALLKADEARHYSVTESTESEADQELITDAQPLAMNILTQQAQVISETDDQAVVQNAQAAIPQFLKQEKNAVQDKAYVQNSLSGEQSTQNDVSPEINLGQLLKREKLINSSNDFVSLASAKGVEKTVEALSTAQSSSEQSNNKFSTADLMALNRQVESGVTKQELPPMTKPFNHPEWKQEFNERIIWMHTKSIPSAQLRLNPQSLGPISIQVNIDKDQQASIVFNAQNAGVREAIEASIPKLREMLNAQQFNLAEVNVSQQQQQQQGQGSTRQAMQDAMAENNKNNARNFVGSAEIESEEDIIAEEISQGRAVASKGLLSIYA